MEQFKIETAVGTITISSDRKNSFTPKAPYEVISGGTCGWTVCEKGKDYGARSLRLEYHTEQHIFPHRAVLGNGRIGSAAATTTYIIDTDEREVIKEDDLGNTWGIQKI